MIRCRAHNQGAACDLERGHVGRHRGQMGHRGSAETQAVVWERRAASRTTLCNKVPLGGDGSRACALELGHDETRGHEDGEGASWSACQPERRRDRRAGGARTAEVDARIRTATQSLIQTAENRVRWYDTRLPASQRTPAHAVDALVLAITLCELAHGKPASHADGLEMVRQITGGLR